MAKKIFMTGTETDIGKTYVSALIVKKMRECGYNCGYYKPVVSGVEINNGRLTAGDPCYVIKTAGIPEEAENCVSYMWEEPLSPHLAAARAGNLTDIGKIRHDFSQMCKKYDYLLTEGAGGITCPIRLENGEKYLLKDLILELGLSTIITADAGLGTINSVLLTVDYARKNGIDTAGIILNNWEQENFMHKDNLKQIEYLTGIDVIAAVPHNARDIILLEKFFRE